MATSATYQLVIYDGANNALQDITGISKDKKGSYRLNRPTVWTFRVASELATQLVKGRRLKVRRDGVCVFNGIIMFIKRRGSKNTDTWAEVIAVDPRVWWEKRPLRDETGDFSRPIFTALETATLGATPNFKNNIPTFRPIAAGEIVRRAVQASEFWEGTLWLDTDVGTFDDDVPPAADVGIDDLVDWPIHLSDLASTVINTGVVDILIDPVDDGDGFPADVMGILNVVNQAGSDLSGSVHLDWGTGDNSVDDIEHTEDLSTLCNKLWYYLGPPQGVQRYKGNITGDRLEGNPNVPPGTGLPDPPQSDLIALINASRAFYGVAMDVRIYDSGNEFQVLDLFLRLWQTETLLRVNGQELVSITPAANAPYKPFVNYDLGDVIAINAGARLDGTGFAGAQRLYGFDVMPDDEGVERVGQLIASADQG